MEIKIACIGQKGEKHIVKSVLKRASIFFAALAITVVSLFGFATNAYAEYLPEPGSIEITLKDLGLTHYAVSKVTASIYKIGDTDIYGRASVYETYGGGEVPKTAAETQELIDYIAANISKDDFIMEVSSNDGVIIFSDLDMGLYFIMFTKTEKYGVITPLLINLPFWEDDDGRVTGPYWDAEVEPKSEPYNISTGWSGPYEGDIFSTQERPSTARYQGDTPSDRNKGLVSAGDINSPGNAEASNGTTPPGESTTINPVNTGEETPVWVYMLICAALMCGVGIMETGRRQKEKDE